MELSDATGVRCLGVPASLTSDGIAALRLSLAEACADQAARVLVLHGHASSGHDVFCAGADFDELLATADATPVVRGFASLLEALGAVDLPIVAEVTGRASGGGVGLVAVADVVIASEEATFALPEALFGAVPAVIAPVLLRRLRQAQITGWTITGATWSAAEAHAAGLVDRCVPSASLATEVRRASRACSRVDRGAVGELRRYMASMPGSPGDGVELTVRRFRAPDVRARIERFVRDGKAPWMEDE